MDNVAPKAELSLSQTQDRLRSTFIAHAAHEEDTLLYPHLCSVDLQVHDFLGSLQLLPQGGNKPAVISLTPPFCSGVRGVSSCC